MPATAKSPYKASLSDELIGKVAANVIISTNPGQMLKAWRERLGLKQLLVAKEMKISPSVLSDYESGRRNSPGSKFLKRYIVALVTLDAITNRSLERLIGGEDHSAIKGIGEFKKPIRASKVMQSLKGKVLKGKDSLNSYINGYTVLDSINTIYMLSGYDFYRIFGATTERVLVFTKVGMGRSPLVAIRVSQLKPRMVVLHGPTDVDPLAVDLAEREKIILGLSSLSDEKAMLRALAQL